MAMLRHLIVSTGCGYAIAETIMGLTTSTIVVDFVELGLQIERVEAALAAAPSDFVSATAEFNRPVSQAGLSLRNISFCGLSERGDVPSCSAEPFARFASYWGSPEYMHFFVGPILATPTAHRWTLSDDARKELIMKSTVLEGVLMAVLVRVHLAAEACDQRHLDEAWALYAGSATHGPIRLAEKRAPQFATEALSGRDVDIDFSAGRSRVNVDVLAMFEDLQLQITSNNCNAGAQTLANRIQSRLFVPIIQGLLREAWESDPMLDYLTGGADGFIEVVEGWAFSRAVLPAIDVCSPVAAATIARNMDTIGLGPNGTHFLPDGFDAVKAALESTYECLGISCSDVNAMVDETGAFLWQPCAGADIAVAGSIRSTWHRLAIAAALSILLGS
mmetsp:Transcript_23693/g.52259  ORF Transcript_23693/g.52259 Transcript_23693/m.52259 type:complete len:390 (+) Transcript_23693:65-1234(+)